MGYNLWFDMASASIRAALASFPGLKVLVSLMPALFFARYDAIFIMQNLCKAVLKKRRFFPVLSSGLFGIYLL